jgi:hypothetical protein
MHITKAKLPEYQTMLIAEPTNRPVRMPVLNQNVSQKIGIEFLLRRLIAIGYIYIAALTQVQSLPPKNINVLIN